MLRIGIIFISVFIAELGDKTQLATLLFATDQEVNKVYVFLAASAALVLSSLMAVVVGSQLYHLINPKYLQVVSGVGFIIIGALILFSVVKPG